MNIRSIVTNGHTVLLFVLAMFYVAYKAAYPYINPQQPDWQNAAIQAILAVAGVIIYGHGYVATQSQLATLRAAMISDQPTRRVPVVPPDSPDNYLRH